MLIFSPYLFTTNIYDAAIIGVGAHWCQYLAINYKVYFSNGVFKRMQKLYLVLFLIIYSIIMSLLGFKSNFYPDLINLTLLIPLSGQFIHYYLYAFIWKFSDDHIRNNVGKRYRKPSINFLLFFSFLNKYSTKSRHRLYFLVLTFGFHFNLVFALLILHTNLSYHQIFLQKLL